MEWSNSCFFVLVLCFLTVVSSFSDSIEEFADKTRLSEDYATYNRGTLAKRAIKALGLYENSKTLVGLRAVPPKEQYKAGKYTYNTRILKEVCSTDDEIKIDSVVWEYGNPLIDNTRAGQVCGYPAIDHDKEAMYSTIYYDESQFLTISVCKAGNDYGVYYTIKSTNSLDELETSQTGECALEFFVFIHNSISKPKYPPGFAIEGNV